MMKECDEPAGGGGSSHTSSSSLLLLLVGRITTRIDTAATTTTLHCLSRELKEGEPRVVGSQRSDADANECAGEKRQSFDEAVLRSPALLTEYGHRVPH
jgi:hypothetical protein